MTAAVAFTIVGVVAVAVAAAMLSPWALLGVGSATIAFGLVFDFDRGSR